MPAMKGTLMFAVFPACQTGYLSVADQQRRSGGAVSLPATLASGLVLRGSDEHAKRSVFQIQTSTDRNDLSDIGQLGKRHTHLSYFHSVTFCDHMEHVDSL